MHETDKTGLTAIVVLAVIVSLYALGIAYIGVHKDKGYECAPTTYQN